MTVLPWKSLFNLLKLIAIGDFLTMLAHLVLWRRWKTQIIPGTMALWSQARTGLMGGKQLGFSDYELTTAKKQTKRQNFLSEMEVVAPWQALIDLIESHYPKTSKKGCKPPYPLASMLRIYLLQQC